jgi:NADPH-dependent 2,4-dienoyl-CoA reductase/sulfur reductase-like enzyme
MRAPLVIIGNGGAAAEAVLALRANGYRGEIHLFADNRNAPYNPMLGPYLVAGKIPLEQVFPFGDGLTFYADNGVTAHLGEPVVQFDAEERELATAAGASYRYERCLIATGARPAPPPITGLREALAPSEGPPWTERRVFTLQTLDDAMALQRAVADMRARGEPLRAAVLGASFAGVKIAAVLHDLGFNVTLVERETYILPLAAHPEAARIMESHLLEQGYELRLGAALAGVRTAAGAGVAGAGATGAARAAGAGAPPAIAGDKIRLDFGALPGAADPGGAGGTACEESAAQVDVDLLVVCTGNRPALGFLTPGQVAMGSGILVDEQMCSNIPTLFAAGDVAQGKNLLSGRREIIGLWSSARYQGRAAGRSLSGVPSGYGGGVPHNITHVGGMLFASVGCVDEYDKVAISHKDDSWQVRLWQDGRLVGVNLLNCCLSAGVTRQTLLRAATGATGDTEATWTSFSG